MPELLEKKFLFPPAIIVIIILNSKQSFLFAGMQAGFSTVRDALQLALGA